MSMILAGQARVFVSDYAGSGPGVQSFTSGSGGQAVHPSRGGPRQGLAPELRAECGQCGVWPPPWAECGQVWYLASPDMARLQSPPVTASYNNPADIGMMRWSLLRNLFFAQQSWWILRDFEITRQCQWLVRVSLTVRTSELYTHTVKTLVRDGISLTVHFSLCH